MSYYTPKFLFIDLQFTCNYYNISCHQKMLAAVRKCQLPLENVSCRQKMLAASCRQKMLAAIRKCQLPLENAAIRKCQLPLENVSCYQKGKISCRKTQAAIRKQKFAIGKRKMLENVSRTLVTIRKANSLYFSRQYCNILLTFFNAHAHAFVHAHAHMLACAHTRTHARK